jgi:hypothetical protein
MMIDPQDPATQRQKPRQKHAGGRPPGSKTGGALAGKRETLARLKAQLADAKEAKTIDAEIAQVSKELTDLGVTPGATRSHSKPQTTDEIHALRMTMPQHPQEGD